MPKQYNQLPQVAFSILLALSLRSRHGYEIMKQVAEDSNDRIKLSPGSLYSSIKQLRQQSLIAETSQPSDDERRRYYEITDTGRQVLDAELAHYARSVDIARSRQLQADDGTA